jgi:hypothetical protein
MLLIKNLIIFFSLDRKETKDQDLQKKSVNSLAHFAEILKLSRTKNS